MVEVMKIMVTSFKRSHAHTTLRAPDSVAGHCQPTLPPETPGPSGSLEQSLVGSLLLSPGSWCARGSVCALQESISPVLCKFWWLYGGLLVTSSKRAYAIHRSTAPRASSLLQQSTADPYLLRRHPNIVLSQSLWGLWVLVSTRFV